MKRFFKNIAQNTNDCNVIWALLSQENLQQIVRFILNNFFTSIPEDVLLTKQIHMLFKFCPHLFNSILPRSEQQNSQDLNPENLPIIENLNHLKPYFHSPFRQEYLAKQLQLPIWCSSLEINDIFAVSLRMAHAQNCNMSSIASLGGFPMQWVKKVDLY